MIYKLSFYLGLSVLLASCAGSNKATTKKQTLATNTAIGDDVCRQTLQADAPYIAWMPKTDDVFKAMESPVMLPKAHDVYAVDTAQLRAFFNAAKKGEVQTAIPLANGMGCRVFTLKRSGAMSEELQQKYPDMISLQGQDRDTKAGDARVDYNGKAVQIQIQMDNVTYLMKPISSGGVFYYVMYRKEAPQPGAPAEQPAAPAKPRQPQQLKYDR